MSIHDILELVALVAGPLSAVLITLWVENNRNTRERKTAALRVVLTMRHDPSNILFTQAINVIPIEFRRNEWVLSAYEEFLFAATEKRLDGSQMSRLIIEMMVDLGTKRLRSEQITRSGYVSSGYVDQQKFIREVLESVKSISEGVKRIADTSGPTA